MNSPLVSIVIPAYNSARTIGEALDSVAAQTFTDYEVIVIDDASSDNTVEVVRAWGGDKAEESNRSEHRTVNIERPTLNAERIGSEPVLPLRSSAQDSERNEHQNREGCKDVDLRILALLLNSGPAAARNRGIAEAKGEWIAFLDADDVWLPEKLEIQIRHARGRPAAALFCGQTMELREKVGDCGLKTVDCGKSDVEGGEVSLSAREVPVRLEDFALSNPVATSTVMVRKSVIAEVGGFDERFRGPEDYDLWMRIAAKHEVVKIEEPLARYREVAGSLSMDDRKFLPQVMGVLEKAFGVGGVFQSLPHWRKAAESNQYWSASWMAFSRSARSRAIVLWTKAYRLNRQSVKKADRKWLRLLLRYVAGSQ